MSAPAFSLKHFSITGNSHCSGRCPFSLCNFAKAQESLFSKQIPVILPVICGYLEKIFYGNFLLIELLRFLFLSRVCAEVAPADRARQVFRGVYHWRMRRPRGSVISNNHQNHFHPLSPPSVCANLSAAASTLRGATTTTSKVEATTM